MGFLKRLFGREQEELPPMQVPPPSMPAPDGDGWKVVHSETKVMDVSDDPEARDAVINAVEIAMKQDVDGDGKIGKG